MEKLRVYRPRIVLYGSSGMGQNFVAAAVLHHLEGYHVQTLDLGSLLGDSARVCNLLLCRFSQCSPFVDRGSRHCSTLCRGQTSSTFSDLHSFTRRLVCHRL